MASSALATTLCIEEEFYRKSEHRVIYHVKSESPDHQWHDHPIFFVSPRLRGGVFLNSCARSNSAASSLESRFSRMCARRCSNLCSASARFFWLVMAMSRHIE